MTSEIIKKSNRLFQSTFGVFLESLFHFFNRVIFIQPIKKRKLERISIGFYFNVPPKGWNQPNALIIKQLFKKYNLKYNKEIHSIFSCSKMRMACFLFNKDEAYWIDVYDKIMFVPIE